jgi:hypothetical protein
MQWIRYQGVASWADRMRCKARTAWVTEIKSMNHKRRGCGTRFGTLVFTQSFNTSVFGPILQTPWMTADGDTRLIRPKVTRVTGTAGFQRIHATGSSRDKYLQGNDRIFCSIDPVIQSSQQEETMSQTVNRNIRRCSLRRKACETGHDSLIFQLKSQNFGPK